MDPKTQINYNEGNNTKYFSGQDYDKKKQNPNDPSGINESGNQQEELQYFAE